MEYEIRYYYNKKELNKIINKLSNISNLTKSLRTYEKTSQFDHPCQDTSFYSKEIDGRFRIRISQNEINSKCMISWKKRLKPTKEFEINKEEEIEISINPKDYKNLLFLIEGVLKMKKVESYERYRTTFYNEEIEIAVDEYPFGIALELENKSYNSNPEAIVKKWAAILNLDISKSYKLSWDDKYTELCRNQNVEIYNNVTFDSTMPEVL